MYQIAVIFLRCFVNGGVAAYRRARKHPTYLAQTIYGVFLGFMASSCYGRPRCLSELMSQREPEPELRFLMFSL